MRVSAPRIEERAEELEEFLEEEDFAPEDFMPEEEIFDFDLGEDEY